VLIQWNRCHASKKREWEERSEGRGKDKGSKTYETCSPSKEKGKKSMKERGRKGGDRLYHMSHGEKRRKGKGKEQGRGGKKRKEREKRRNLFGYKIGVHMKEDGRRLHFIADAEKKNSETMGKRERGIFSSLPPFCSYNGGGRGGMEEGRRRGIDATLKSSRRTKKSFRECGKKKREKRRNLLNSNTLIEGRKNLDRRGGGRKLGREFYLYDIISIREEQGFRKKGGEIG